MSGFNDSGLDRVLLGCFVRAADSASGAIDQFKHTVQIQGGKMDLVFDGERVPVCVVVAMGHTAVADVAAAITKVVESTADIDGSRTIVAHPERQPRRLPS